MDVGAFNALDHEAAAATLQLCCVSQRWINGVLAGRPYPSTEALSAAANEVWNGLAREDFLEAFEGHPKIGDVRSLKPEYAGSRELAASEQSGALDVQVELVERLAEGNQKYLERFGYIFIVCATGKSALQICELMEARLANSPSDELLIAAEEQRKILQLRLEKFL